MDDDKSKKKRRRKPANAHATEVRLIKATVEVVEPLNIKWTAAAALAGVSKSRYAAIAIEEACQSIVLFDRRKRADQGHNTDRADEASLISDDEEKAA